jgi:hypothetical protein
LLFWFDKYGVYGVGGLFAVTEEEEDYHCEAEKEGEK